VIRTNAGTGYQGYAAEPAQRHEKLRTLDDKLDDMVWQVRQLTQPVHLAVRRQILTHQSLLDQLRDACTPSTSTLMETIRKRARESHPPASTAAISTLSEVYMGISYWHSKLGLPSPDRSLDWQKTALQQVATAADTLAPDVAEWLCTEVEGWWRDAANGSGWRPDDLRRLR
jgi:hypothetical protein